MPEEEIIPNEIQKGQIWNKPLTPFMIQFKEETGYMAIRYNKITGQFTYWLFKKGLKKSNFSEINQIMSEAQKEIHNRPEVKEKHSKLMKKVWNKPGYREKMSKINKEAQNRPEVIEKHSIATIKQWQNNEYRESMTGENHPMFGVHRYGEDAPMYGKYKENASNAANHLWIKKYFPQNTFCDNKCEICNKSNLNLDLARFLHINVRNMEDPMIDYFYTCPYIEKNSCHRIYDDNLLDKEKEELLVGVITREEKLNRVREYVLEN